MSTRSLLAGYTVNVWQEIDIRLDPEPFCTSFQISTMKKKSISKTPLKPKKSFKWVFMDIIPYVSSKSLTEETNFVNYLLIVHASSKIPKLYGTEMGKLVL